MKWLKKWREHRQEEKRLKRLSTLSKVFAIFDKMIRVGLVSWNDKERRVFISEPVALFFIAQGADRWKTFLSNLYCCQMYRLQQKQWNDYIIDCQTKAVRRRRSEVAMLTKAEVERIRRTTADGISMQDVDLPTIQPFEFFVVQDVVGDKATVLWVGTYDPDTDVLDMAEWDSVRRAIDKNRNEGNRGEE